MKVLYFLLLSSMFLNGNTNENLETLSQESTKFVIASKILNDIITIEISLPEGYKKDIDKKYNSIYLLDANYFFDEYEGTLDFLLKRGEGMEKIVKKLTMSGDIPPTILIGIGYSEQQRGQFTMNNVDKFHEFFSKELIPKIESEFRVSNLANDRLLFGYSGSAHFSTYLMMNDVINNTQTFGKFISISGVYTKNTEAYKLEETLGLENEKNILADRSLFIGIGDSDPKIELLKAHREFTKKLKARNHNDFRLYTTEFPNRGHYDLPEFAFEEGLKWLFKN